MRQNRGKKRSGSNLIERWKNVVGELNLSDGCGARDRQSDAKCNNALLGQGRVKDSVFALMMFDYMIQHISTCVCDVSYLLCSYHIYPSVRLCSEKRHQKQRPHQRPLCKKETKKHLNG